MRSSENERMRGKEKRRRDEGKTLRSGSDVLDDGKEFKERGRVLRGLRRVGMGEIIRTDVRREINRLCV